MTLPAAWTQVPITGKFIRLDGRPAIGATVRFEVTQQGLVVDATTILRSNLSARLDAEGRVPAGFTLPATNDPDLSVVNWTYTVFEEFEGGRAPYTIAVPYDAPEIDLNLATDTPPSPEPVDGYLRDSDIGTVVASQAAVETAQASATAAAGAAATAQATADAHIADLSNPHVVTAAQIGAVPTTALGVSVPQLVDGKIPVGQLPSIAITNVFVVNSEAAQLALVAEEGDVAKRTDFAPAKTYIHNGGSAGTMADWTEVENPDLAAHEAAPDPHPGYVLESLLGQAGAPPALDAAAALAAAVSAKKRVATVPVAGALALDLSLGADFAITLAANVTSTTVSNGPPAGYAREGTLIFAQDATGGRTWAAPVGSKWPNGLAAVLTSTANAVDHIGYRVYNNAGTLEYTFYPVRDVR